MKRKGLRVLVVLLIIVLLPGVVGVAAYGTLRVMGEKSLESNATSVVPDMPVIVPDVKEIIEVSEDTVVQENEALANEEVDDSIEAGQVMFDGKKYQYNSDIKSFVFMGIDKKENQTPLIMLGAMNPHNKKIQLIVVNRNTLIETKENNQKGQIRYQYMYGDGGADSCERVVAAVDEVMRMIPIHGYYAIDMEAIITINDAVGGEKISSLDEVMDNGSYKRFMTGLMKKIVEKTKTNMSFPIELYKQVSAYSVTDVSVDEMTYLVSKAAGFEFGNSDVLNVPGTLDRGEFYVDEHELDKLIIEVFYEPVN